MTARCLADAAGVLRAAARGTMGWSGAAGAAAQAEALRRRALALGDDNARAYTAARRALDGSLPSGGQQMRDHVLGTAVEAAGVPPSALAMLGSDVAALAVHIAGRADASRLADVVAAAAVAAGAADAAAHLVAINIATPEACTRRAEAQAAAARAGVLATHLLDGGG